MAWPQVEEAKSIPALLKQHRMGQGSCRLPGEAVQRELPARHRMLTAGGREKACDGGALSAVRTAEGSRHKRALQSR